MKIFSKSPFKPFGIALIVLLFWSSLSFASNEADFFKAVLAGDKAAVEQFLTQGLDINLKNPDGFTALAVASQKGHAALS